MRSSTSIVATSCILLVVLLATAVAASSVFIGKPAPNFTKTSVIVKNGKPEFTKLSISDYKGKWLVVVFYPLDFTVRLFGFTIIDFFITFYCFTPHIRNATHVLFINAYYL